METEDELTERLGVPATTVPDETMTLGAGRVVLDAPPTEPRPSLPSFEGDLIQLGIIAEGGMGRVYHARQVALSRDVAVKTTKRDAAPKDIDALLREARVCGGLEHPSIIPVYALGTSTDGRTLLVMRKVEGVTWRELLGDPKHPAWETHASAGGDHLGANIDILIAISRALDFAHLRGIVHRDIKPSNVMLGQFGEVYLVDWGIAVEMGHATKEVVGSPGFFAPEMVRGEPVDAATDVYLLGATLHRVLTGKMRHSNESLMASVADAALSPAKTYAADVPKPLADLANAACARARANRPASAAAFREALLSFKRSRSAIAMCKVATERLHTLERLLAAVEGPPSELAFAYRVATEARFGFAQALTEQPNHTPAKEGKSRIVRALIDLELRQGHVDTASALLAEAPELAPRVDEAREAQKGRDAEHERLVALARDLDPTIGSSSLVRLAGALALALAGVAIYAGVGTFPVLTHEQLAARLLGFATLPLVCIAVAAAVLRRRLFANAFNVRIVAMVTLCCAGSLVHRFVVLRHGADLAQILTQDLLLFAFGATATTLTLNRRAVILLPALLGGALLIELRPESALPIYNVVTLITFVALVVAVRRPRVEKG